jgi:hypothetical protein
MSDKKTLPKWTEERTTQLTDIVGDDSPVTVDTVTEAAEALGTTVRSVASKLRKMDYEVESSAAVHTKSFSDAQEAKLRSFVEGNQGKYTYAEIAAYVLDDADKARQVQGKLLSMDLTGMVRKTPPKEVKKEYTDEQEAVVLKMCQDGAYLEDIAEAVDKSLNSVRGKCLSLTRSNDISMPKQKNHYAKTKVDPLADIENVSEMTVAEIAVAIEKTERGVKTMLTHRGLTAKDYDGAARSAKLAEKKAAQA